LGYGGAFLVALESLLRLVQGGVLRVSLGGWAPPWGLEANLDASRAGALAAAAVALGAAHFLRESTPGGDDPWEAPYTGALRLAVLAALAASVAVDDALARFGAFQMAALAEAGLLVRAGSARSAFKGLMRVSAGSALYLAGAGLMFARTGTFHLEGWAGRLASDGPVPHAPECLVLILFGCLFMAWPFGGTTSADVAVLPERIWRSRLFLWQGADMVYRVFHLSPDAEIVRLGSWILFLLFLIPIWTTFGKDRPLDRLSAASLMLLPALAPGDPGLFLWAAAAQAWALTLIAPAAPDTPEAVKGTLHRRVLPLLAAGGAALALAGVPPTSGFPPVWEALRALRSAPSIWMFGQAAVLGLLGFTSLKVVWGRTDTGEEAEAWRWVLFLGTALGGIMVWIL